MRPLLFFVLVLGVLRGTTSTVVHTVTLKMGSSVNMEVGPEDAIYCQLMDTYGTVVYEGFGRCVLNIDRVDALISRTWPMYVGLPGKVLTDAQLLSVQFAERESSSRLEMSVSMSHDDNSLTVSCLLETTSIPSVCKFRHPRGHTLIHQKGVSEGRYSSSGNGVSYENGVNKMDCGLKISNPELSDLGNWRCGVDTDEDSHYAFLLVTCPWLMKDEDNASAVETTPILRPDGHVQLAKAGSSAIMRCFVPSSIRYCYFRSENGAVLTLSPGVSTESYEYFGNGLAAGDCGVRLKAAAADHRGDWTCNVGLLNASVPERSVKIKLSLTERFMAYANRIDDGSVQLGATSSLAAIPDYCRFVRDDGFAFTGDLTPDVAQVYMVSKRSGQCDLRIMRPYAVDLRPWTVVAKFPGDQDEAMTRTPNITVNYYYSYSLFFVIRISLIFLCIGLIFIAFGILLGPKKNRQWTYARARAVRDSLRRSSRKSPPLQADNNAASSPQAA